METKAGEVDRSVVITVMFLLGIAISAFRLAVSMSFRPVAGPGCRELFPNLDHNYRSVLAADVPSGSLVQQIAIRYH
jgi:hypothetical protein